MASTLCEISNSKSDITSAGNFNLAERQCNHIKMFKEFLRDLTKDAVANQSGKDDFNVSCNGCSEGSEIRPFILTRSNNESYSLTKDELSAEIVMCIWQWLSQKQCPEHFKLGVSLSAYEEITNEVNNKKLEKELKTTNVNDGKDVTDTIKLDLLKLQKYIHFHLEKFLLRLSDNSKQENLKNFADCRRENKSSCDSGALNNHKEYAEGRVKNKPRKMEDRHICLPQFSGIYQIEEPLSFYAIFDGHSGSLSATYATNQIPYLVAQQIKSARISSSSKIDIYREALETSFLQCDHNFGQKQMSSGTTAVCALLIKNGLQNYKQLYVAWVGDSRCLLVSPTVHLQLVKPHKPDSADERKRIESVETGGSVLFVQGQWRVNGIINVSRSIGDYNVKAVIAEPDIVDVPLQLTHDFLVLGSDGLWDHVSEREIVDCIYKSIIDDKQCLDDIPKHLIELAKQGDSQDNITVVLVLLKDRQQIKEYFLNS